MPALELGDIQGLLVRGYSKLPACRFLLLGINDGAKARQWLHDLLEAGLLTRGDQRPGHEGEPDFAINIALTVPAMATLGLSPAALEQFPRELREGMTQEPRPRLMGDHGASSPENWEWGGPAQPVIHVLLLLYAVNEQRLTAVVADQVSRIAGGLALQRTLETHVLEHRKEQFGFHDGLAQPQIAGLGEPGLPANTVQPGEFILGYPNQYDALPDSPSVPASSDPKSLLGAVDGDASQRDLGRNGSYLVFRQLSQDVHGFWRFVDQQSRRSDGAADPESRIRLAAKMVGRWPSGAPLALASSHDNEKLEDMNDFGYAREDPFGERCPIGSHCRRSNPRDSMAPDPEESLLVSNRHRLLRRGRMYGAPLDPGFDVDAILKADDGVDRGVHFVCFNTDIERQFEFIQQTWINNPKFEGLYADADPLMGDHDPHDDGSTGTFTVQASPVRRRIRGLPRFVHMKGGAYFFFPGLRALRYLAAS